LISIESNLKDKLSHLSQDEIETLMKRYYSGEKVKELIDEYDLDISASLLYKSFPKSKKEGELCDYCDITLEYEAHSRSSWRSNLAMCPNCGHYNSEFCTCEKCQEIAAKKEELIKEKIASRYFIDKSNPRYYNELSLEEKVFLGAYIRKFYDYEKDLIQSLDNDEDISIMNTRRETKLMLIQLLNNNFIKVHPKSDFYNLREIIKSGAVEIKTVGNICFYLNIIFKDKECSDQEIINRIREPNTLIEKSHGIDAIEKMWLEVAAKEVERYLLFEMGQINFNFSIGEKSKRVIRDILKYFSTAQAYNFVNYAIKNAAKYYQMKHITKRRAANSVITNMEKRSERAISNEWEIYSYGRFQKIGQTECNWFFYNKILFTDKDGFHMIPNFDNLMKILEEKQNKMVDDMEY